MEQWFVEFSGVRLCIRFPAGYLPGQMGGLEPFAVPAGEYDRLLELTVVEELDAPVGECVFRQPDKEIYLLDDLHLRYDGAVDGSLNGANVRIDRRGNKSQIQVRRKAIPAGITPKLVMACMEVEHLIAEQGGFLLHASVIRFRDKAVLFTAPSGTGKSTQADLWCHLRGAELINGDRTVVRDGRVWGIPFCGSSGVAKKVTLPLAAIVYLSQGCENSVTRLTGFRAFRQVWEGCSVNVWNRKDMERCTQAVMDAISAAPVLHLVCTPDENAVSLLQEVLEKEGAI
jgi:hypothetical protein